MTKPSWTILLGTKSVLLSEALIDTLKRFKLLDLTWSKNVNENNYLHKAAVKEIKEQEYEDYVTLVVNGVTVPRNSSYS